jgi:hypothetical protein
MKSYSIFLSVVLVVCAGLVAACKRPESTAAKPAEKSRPAVARLAPVPEKKPLTQEQLADKKLAVYANLYNILIHEEGGLPDGYRMLTKKVLKGKSSDSIDFPVIDDLEKILASLKQNRAEAAADRAGVDKAADALIAAGDRLLAHEKELVPYFRDRIYKADDMARARAMFADLEKDYESALDALSDLGTEILKSRRAAAEKRMEELKAAGDMVRYHTEEIMMLSEELLALFDDPRVPFNRDEAFSKGNNITIRLNNAIQAQRKAADDVRTKDGKVSPYYDAIRNSAGSMISDYREVRDKRSQSAFDSMLKKYDKAVQDYNSAQMKA